MSTKEKQLYKQIEVKGTGTSTQYGVSKFIGVYHCKLKTVKHAL